MKIFVMLLLMLCIPFVLSACGASDTPDVPDIFDTSGTSEDVAVDPVVKTAAELRSMGYIPEDVSGRMFESSGEGIYNYCPSIFEASDGVRHIYYCTNKDNKLIYDYIGYRSAVKASDTDVWYYSPETLVLAPLEKVTVWDKDDYNSSGFSWYSLHICDPSVIKGRFTYYDYTYQYLMAVLVCANPYCLDNEIALAVADAPEGPWILCDDTVNPVVRSKRMMADWGVGQPEMISMDQAGQVWLLYTEAAAGAVWQAYDMSDLQNVQTISARIAPSRAGTSDRVTGRNHALYNSAYAWDPDTSCLYMITEKFPHYIHGEEPVYPDQVGAVQELFCYEYDAENPLELIRYARADRWKSLCTIGPEDSGKPRNHNAAIIRDPYGYINGNGIIEMAVTVNDAGDTGDNNTYLWDYRIARFEYDNAEQ